MTGAPICVFWHRPAGGADGSGGFVEESVFQRMSGHDATHWWFVARRRILRDGIAALGLPPDAQVLEADCGRGRVSS